MKTKYTSGEWIAKDGQIYSEETGKTHALIPYFDKENAEQIANAKLIASAPELLETLKKLKSDAEVYLKIFTTNEILIDGAKLMMCNNLLGAIAELANEAIVKATE